MNSKNELIEIESLYMALADKTRLRLLSLMRNTEICVNEITETLGDSQPKVSRHLAYLRNAGVVAARRDGKWMHYRIVWPEDERGKHALAAALDWVAMGDEEARAMPEHRRNRSAANTRLRDDTEWSAESKRATEGNTGNDQTVVAHNELEEFLL